MRLADTVALVTGGGSGIGRAICLRFAREGAAVVAVDWKVERAQETVGLIEQAGGRALALEADVSSAAAGAEKARAARAGPGRGGVLGKKAAIGRGEQPPSVDPADRGPQRDLGPQSGFPG